MLFCRLHFLRNACLITGVILLIIQDASNLFKCPHSTWQLGVLQIEMACETAGPQFEALTFVLIFLGLLFGIPFLWCTCGGPYNVPFKEIHADCCVIFTFLVVLTFYGLGYWQLTIHGISIDTFLRTTSPPYVPNCWFYSPHVSGPFVMVYNNTFISQKMLRHHYFNLPDHPLFFTSSNFPACEATPSQQNTLTQLTHVQQWPHVYHQFEQHSNANHLDRWQQFQGLRYAYLALGIAQVLLFMTVAFLACDNRPPQALPIPEQELPPTLPRTKSPAAALPI
jgi:hypothetical protein